MKLLLILGIQDVLYQLNSNDPINMGSSLE
jgi:hypothetical protein